MNVNNGCDVLLITPFREYFFRPYIMIHQNNVIVPTILTENYGINAFYFNPYVRDLRNFKVKRFLRLLDVSRRNYLSKNIKMYKKRIIFLEKTVKKCNPKVVLINVQWEQFLINAIEICKILKRINENIIVVLMGDPIERIDKHLFSYDMNCFDYIIKGEHEIPAINLVITLLKGMDKISHVKGLYIKNSHNKFVFTGENNTIIDLNEIPVPNKDYVLYRKWYPPLSFGHIEVSRGCPYSCKFCVYSKYRYPVRIKKPERVIKEMLIYIKKYRVREFDFSTSSFLLNKNLVERLSDFVVSKKINIIYHCYMNTNHVDEEHIRMIKKSGCMDVSFGFESGSERILRLVNKPATVSDNIKALEICKKNKISVNASFIFGFPFEKENDIKNSIEFIKNYASKLDSFTVLFWVPRLGSLLGDEYIRHRKFKRINLENMRPIYLHSGSIATKKYEKYIRKIMALGIKKSSLMERKKLMNMRFLILKTLEYFHSAIKKL